MRSRPPFSGVDGAGDGEHLLSVLVLFDGGGVVPSLRRSFAFDQGKEFEV